jgi:hypothetical protein
MANFMSTKQKEWSTSEVEKNQALIQSGDIIRLQGSEKVTVLEVYEAGFEYTAWDGEINCLGWDDLQLHASIVSAKRISECLFLNLDNPNYDRWLSHQEYQKLSAWA